MSILFTDQTSQFEFLRVIHHERAHAAQGDTLDRATWGNILTWLPRSNYMRVVMLHFSQRDTKPGGNGATFPCEFSWHERWYEVDTVGIPKIAPSVILPEPDSESRRLVVLGMTGGIINHGTPDKPEWIVHT